MRIRGDSGFGEISETSLKNDPNQPTFILDGYEVTAEKVYDLNMDRVESVTILKDASATAIYGSRAANGVIVITTKRQSLDVCVSAISLTAWCRLLICAITI